MVRRVIDPKNLRPKEQLLFDVLQTAAIMGDRCPCLDELIGHGIPTSVTPAELARAGLINVEIYGQNFRVVEMRSGYHKGKRTLTPKKGKPVKKITSTGSFDSQGKCLPEPVRTTPEERVVAVNAKKLPTYLPDNSDDDGYSDYFDRIM